MNHWLSIRVTQTTLGRCRFGPWLFIVQAVLFTSLVSAAEMNTPATSTAATAASIVVIGDSISAGYGLKSDESWVSLLRTRLREQGYRQRVVNASITGDTTRGGLARLPQLLKREQPSLVIVELGGNDGLRAIGIDVMRRNLQRLIELIQQADAKVLLLGMKIPANYGFEYSEQFHNTYRELAVSLGIPLVDFLLEGIALDAELMQADGIHPNAKAQPILLNTVWPKLQPLLSIPKT